MQLVVAKVTAIHDVGLFCLAHPEDVRNYFYIGSPTLHIYLLNEPAGLVRLDKQGQIFGCNAVASPKTHCTEFTISNMAVHRQNVNLKYAGYLSRGQQPTCTY